MDNMNIILASNIQKLRKNKGLTQEELAKELGVTFQAISKWENAKSAPDIFFLPKMAEIFGCYIDELFSRDIHTEIHYDLCTAFPWKDDDTIRGVVCLGRKILQISDEITDKFTFEIVGDAKSVQSECNIMVSGSVSAGCNANGEVVIGRDLSGGCNSGGQITVGGHLSGGCNCSSNITCGGNLSGDVNCNGTVTVDGDIGADKIKVNVVCNVLKCDWIEGDVTINEEK